MLQNTKCTKGQWFFPQPAFLEAKKIDRKGKIIISYYEKQNINFFLPGKRRNFSRKRKPTNTNMKEKAPSSTEQTC